MSSLKPILLAPRPLEKQSGVLHLSKEWVLPPRPKPGRKPITDDPPTKRKAQNRAAQRAFRERRANRVAELEDHIMHLQREASIKEGTLQNEINQLKIENSNLKSKIKELKSSNNNNKVKDEIFDIKPMPAVPLIKKRRQQQQQQPTPEELETDFTDFFNDIKRSKPMPKFTHPPITTPVIVDEPFEECGFCSEDTPCVCRDAKQMEMDIQRKERDLINEIIRDVKSDVNQMAQCSGDPGSCSKCQLDPQMTNFCKKVSINERDLPSLSSLGLDKHYIPCSDAFKFISKSIPNGIPKNIVPQLASNLNRSGMMVEVESVVSCIRDLDKSFSSSLS